MARKPRSSISRLVVSHLAIVLLVGVLVGLGALGITLSRASSEHSPLMPKDAERVAR